MAFLDLFRPKWKHSDWTVRIEAIKEVTDQKVLASVAKNDVRRDVRIAAIKKVMDQNVLIDVAKDDKDGYVRVAAIEKVTDQNVLIDVAKNDEDIHVRAGAILRITDQKARIKAFEELGLEDPEYRSQGVVCSSPVRA